MVKEEHILFAADTLMPVPFFSDGSWSDYVTTLEALLPHTFENVVQGHGEVILRGEVRDKIEEDLRYLHRLRAKVEKVIKHGKGPETLAHIDIESCGKSRIPLNGLVEHLHRSNAEKLYWALQQEYEHQT
jgi:glyoxylase-like metal-dependent hydrolase (beta-lactamase superfamily II)